MKYNIPSDVKVDLERAVKLMTNLQPKIREIRLFGSLQNGTWERERSDIDLSVLVEEDKRFRLWGMGIQDGLGFGYDIQVIDHPDKKTIRDIVKSHCVFGERYTLYIWIPSDAKYLAKINEGRGNLYEAIQTGLVLYKRD